jgi:peptidoglycan/LPS O-acetylase OafA/YrhL
MKQGDELPALTGIRGLAAVTVVLHHYRIPGFGYGYLAVDLFFVLSGFVLAHVYRDGVEPLAFLRARAARTLPVHFATTMMLGLAVVPFGYCGWSQVAAALVGVRFVNPPAWSLVVEWYAYLLFPVVAALPFARRIPPVAVIAVCLGIAVVTDLFVVLSGQHNAFIWGILKGLPEFAAGVAIYRMGWRPRRSLVLDNSFVVWLGDISYPLYLIHMLPFLLMTGKFPAMIIGSLPLPLTVLSIAASFVLAVVLHHAVEVPGRRWLRSSRWPHLAWARGGS